MCHTCFGLPCLCACYFAPAPSNKFVASPLVVQLLRCAHLAVSCACRHRLPVIKGHPFEGRFVLVTPEDVKQRRFQQIWDPIIVTGEPCDDCDPLCKATQLATHISYWLV